MSTPKKSRKLVMPTPPLEGASPKEREDYEKAVIRYGSLMAKRAYYQVQKQKRERPEGLPKEKVEKVSQKHSVVRRKMTPDEVREIVDQLADVVLDKVMAKVVSTQ